MSTVRPFRFATGVPPFTSADAWIDYARSVESMGYSSLTMGDHPGLGGLAPLTALLVAATATTRLRFATHVLNNDLRHPAMLAQEALTFSALTGGRLELGLGAGWLGRDYQALGIPLDPGRVRIEKLTEAIAIIKGLVDGGSVSFAGEHYRINELDLQILPEDPPRVPLFIGGGRKRLLSLAGSEADIASLDLRSRDGVMDMTSYTAAAMDEQVAWVREAAAKSGRNPELHTLVHSVIMTDNLDDGIRQVRHKLAEFRALGAINDIVLSDEELLESPHVLVGTVDEIAARLRHRRERYGISYLTVFADTAETFAPIVARLTGA